MSFSYTENSQNVADNIVTVTTVSNRKNAWKAVLKFLEEKCKYFKIKIFSGKNFFEVQKILVGWNFLGFKNSFRLFFFNSQSYFNHSPYLFKMLTKSVSLLQISNDQCVLNRIYINFKKC